MRPAQAYLVLYNAALACGWAACLAALVAAAASSVQAGKAIEPADLYAKAAPWAKLSQLASALEIAHAGVGLVRSSPLSAAMLWAGRAHALLVVVDPIAELHASWWAVVMLGAWAVAEIIRYPQYAAAAAGACPGWLTWLRYSMFIPLFPTGTAAEMALMALALPYLAVRQPYTLLMPNSLNYTFEYTRFIQLLLLAYPFLWWQLFSSLLRTRAKKLQGDSKGGKEQ